MSIYRQEVIIYATLYIRAKSIGEARANAREAIRDTSLTLVEQDDAIPISGAAIDSGNLPDISLSPAMTVGKLSGPCARVE